MKIRCTVSFFVAWPRFAVLVDHADSAAALPLPKIRLMPSISHVAPSEVVLPDNVKLVS